MASLKIDDKDFQDQVMLLESVVFPNATKQALRDIGNEIIRLSTFEVPFDIGTLEGTGHIEPDGDGYLVGYNTIYAAYLHEHPEFDFQDGRAAKYLEDPIKNNMPVFLKFAGQSYKEALK